ncbi:unnamed protein product [Linum trigynum]|uniref:PGG domain-containing protein n=1 Tax=Linum trigynum TaxID=586398 RepID=A0AAV2FNZ6_9ROSI
MDLPEEVESNHYNSSAYEAALKHDWKTAGETSVSPAETSILQFAVLSPSSTAFLQNQLTKLPPDSLRVTVDDIGNTLLHSAAEAGNLAAVRVIVGTDPLLTGDLISRRNCFGDTPVHSAAAFANWDVVVYLLSVIFGIWSHDGGDEGRVGDSPLAASQGVRLLQLLIAADFYGIALIVIERYPSLGRGKDAFTGMTALEMLAKRDRASIKKRHGDRSLSTQLLTKNKPSRIAVITSGEGNEGILGRACGLCDTAWRVFGMASPFRAVNWDEALPLLKQLILEANLHFSGNERRSIFGRAMRLAAERGNVLFVEALANSCPVAVLERGDDDDDDGKGRYNMMELAVLHRQDGVFRLLYEKKYFSLGHLLSSTTHIKVDGEDEGNKNNNLLHLAARLGPRRTIYGPFVQIQEELRWFKTVETMIHARLREAANEKGQTPTQVFIQEHKPLVEESEKWLEDISKQCTTIAALMLSAFSASVFASPLSDKDARDNAPRNMWIQLGVTVFTLSNAGAFYCSCIALLLFVAAMVCRHSVLDDFLGVIPRRIGIGLVAMIGGSLFMATSFFASLYTEIASRTLRVDSEAPDQEVNGMGLFFCSLLIVPLMVYTATHAPLLTTFSAGTGRRRELLFS